MLETGVVDINLEMKLSTFAEPNHYMDALVRRSISKKSFITSVTDFIKTAIGDREKTTKVRAFM